MSSPFLNKLSNNNNVETWNLLKKWIMFSFDSDNLYKKELMQNKPESRKHNIDQQTEVQ